MANFNPLGETTQYIDTYAPELLYPIARLENRSAIGLAESLPFTGFDEWTLYELSWLNPQGLPQVAMATFRVDCRSPFIVESKSLKLYLNSWNQTKAKNATEVIETITRDLTQLCAYEVLVQLASSERLVTAGQLPGQCIDQLSVTPKHYQPEASLLVVDENRAVERHCVYSHLLKSNCPVTNQPDWATVFIEYSGRYIIEESLLAYIVSYRQHQGFHENCVERFFVDINSVCKPDELTVYARYTRRGGLDINPLRTNSRQTVLAEVDVRMTRQ